MNEFDKIKEHTVTPSDHLWTRLELKLQGQKQNRYIRKYRNWSIAAVFIAILSCVLVLKYSLSNAKSENFATNYSTQPVVMEPLSSKSSNSFYEMGKIMAIQKVYEKYR